MEFRGVALVPRSAFPVGALGTRRWRRVRRFFAVFHTWLRCLGDITGAQESAVPVEWGQVERDTDRLATAVVRLAHLLQDLEPMQWLDFGEWAAKLTFYARLAAGHPEPPIDPQFFVPLPARRGMVLSSSLWRYAVDVAEIGPQLERGIRDLELAQDAAWQGLMALVESMSLPAVVEREGEVCAFELGGQRLLLCPVLEAPEGELPLEARDVGLREFWDGVRWAWAQRYTPRAVSWRRTLGRCDEEVGCRVVVLADAALWALDGDVMGLAPASSAVVSEPPPPLGLWVAQEGAWSAVATTFRPEAGLWRQRLRTVVERIVSEGEVPLCPEDCRCLEDLSLLALVGGWKAVMSRFGTPSMGIEGVKTLPLSSGAMVQVYCTSGALFPSAAGRQNITGEDIRCLPLWAMLAGWQRLEDVCRQYDVSSPPLTGFGMIKADAMHLCLCAGRHVLLVEGEWLPDALWAVRMRWKAPYPRVEELGWVAETLASWGFGVTRHGVVLDARLTQGSEVAFQRALAVLGGVSYGVLGGGAPGWWRSILASWGQGGGRSPA